MTSHLPPDDAFLRVAIWDRFGIPGGLLDELLDAFGLSRRELWIQIVRQW